jgi:hypothetical protein
MDKGIYYITQINLAEGVEVMVTLYVCIREVLASNIGPDTDYPDLKFFVVYSAFLPRLEHMHFFPILPDTLRYRSASIQRFIVGKMINNENLVMILL